MTALTGTEGAICVRCKGDIVTHVAYAVLHHIKAGYIPTVAITSNAYTQPTHISLGPGPATTQQEYMRLATDMSLLYDASYLSNVVRYAAGSPTIGSLAQPTAGSTAFFKDFAAALVTLQELGVPLSQLHSVSLTAAVTTTPPPSASPSPSPPPSAAVTTTSGGASVVVLRSTLLPLSMTILAFIL